MNPIAKILCVLPISLMFLVQTIGNLKAQNEVIYPIQIEKNALSGIGLDQISLKADPERLFFQKRIYRGQDFSIYMIASEDYNNPFPEFPFDEFVYLINGQAEIVPEERQPYFFNARDYIVAPKGFSGSWNTYGNGTFHLELSIITNQRSGADYSSSTNLPYKIDANKISGVDIPDLNKLVRDSTINDIIYHGSELTVFIQSELSGAQEITANKQEQFVHILSGAITLTAADSKTFTYYTGDFFVLPQGFTGYYEVSGHDLFRSLRVLKT